MIADRLLEQQPDSTAANTEKGKRDYGIDNLKGVLIILVILGHGNLLPSFKSEAGNFLQGYIYLFHMPLFFGLSALFISGFSWAYAAKRFVQLMVPFYFFVIIDPIHIIMQLIHPGMSVVPLLYNPDAKDVIKQVFIGSAYYLQNALWFLPALFMVNVLLSVLIKYRSSKVLLLVFGITFCLVLLFAGVIERRHYIIPYGIDVAIYIMPFLVLLRYVYANKTRALSYHPLIYVAGIIIVSVLIHFVIPKIPAWALSGRFDLAQFYVPDTIWGYLLICSLSVFIFLIFLNFNKSTIFSKIGNYTMPIFILHTYPWFTSLYYIGPGWYLLIDVVGLIVVSILISKILMKISPKFRWIGMVA